MTTTKSTPTSTEESVSSSPRQCEWLCKDWDGTLNGRQCLLKGRPDLCPIHQEMQKPWVSQIVSTDMVKEVISTLEEDDPWRDADLLEIDHRAQGYRPVVITYKGYEVTIYR